MDAINRDVSLEHVVKDNWNVEVGNLDSVWVEKDNKIGCAMQHRSSVARLRCHAGIVSQRRQRFLKKGSAPLYYDIPITVLLAVLAALRTRCPGRSFFSLGPGILSI